MRTNFFRNIENYIAEQASLNIYCQAVNLRNALRGKLHRVTAGEDGLLHSAYDGQTRIHLCRRGRHNRYKRGVMAGVDALAREYHLDKIPTFNGGTFIDCGANVGELGYWARERAMTYIAFEPEGPEARCCDLNNYEGQEMTHRKALWKEDTVLEFHSKPDTADSSVFEIDNSAACIRINAVALDNIVDTATLSGTVILKVEAEGAEPEVLEGAKKTLPFIDYVTVDCGYERGIEKKHTFVETCEILHDAGFKLANAQFRRITALYRNTQKNR
ncbi:MAG: FkbM family methyltransferase [Rhodobiaceae bacterium]|nr:FkbM family methyltransferase [Rhodobiaceae bacterium]MCC0012106.1 FkbM family methyltransferase [Rhodobiaceae bacterium]MCC0060978.1 FkbM family methyltransferase [Rhodobiaceae bacterium]